MLLRFAFSVLAVFCGALFAAADRTAQTACESRSIAAIEVRDRADVEAFLRCAHELIGEVGVEAAYEAFHNDPRWYDGATYVFATEAIPDSSRARTLLFPPNPARENTEPETLTDRSDVFGGDSQAEAVRIIEEFGGGWWYYAFTNPVTGAFQPKSTFILPVDWNGTPAFIGSGVYRRDFPGACNRQDVYAGQLDSAPSDGRLEEFVRCAAAELESQGYSATMDFQNDPRWNSGSIYVFGVDLRGNQVFTGSPVRVNGQSLLEWAPLGSPTDQFNGRDVAAAVDTFGESYLYYTAWNPATGRKDRKVSFLKRVIAHGVSLLVGAGYYVDDAR